MADTGFIYLITNKVNGKYYVGQTCDTISSRWREHRYETKDPERDEHLYRAIRKYGPENFIVEQLAEAPTASLDNLESCWIILLDSQNRSMGYNLKSGGSHGKHSEESKKKMSENRKGIAPWNIGGHLSKETRDKISRSSLGKVGFWTGKKLSEETRDKISTTLSGRKLSEEHREKLRLSLLGNQYTKGHKLSDEHRQKIGDSLKNNVNGGGNKGKPKSEEWRHKISEARKKWWATKKGLAV